MAEKSRLIKPENTLKKKVGHGGFDEKVLINAQKVIEENTIDFKPMGLEFVGMLSKDLAEIKAQGSEFDQNEAHDKIMYPLMQLKAQGALFHYPLVTKVSFIVVDFLENITGLDKEVFEIVEAYKKAVTAILMMEIKDENAAIGRQLCDELGAACARYYKAKGKV